MSAQTEAVERCLVAYNRHDAADFASYFAEDGVLRVVATGEVNEGREQIRIGADQRWEMLDYTLETRGIYESGRDVFVEWTLSGTHVGEILGIPATHRRVEGLLGCSHFTLGTDGLIVRDLVYFDAFTLLSQLGLVPELNAVGVTTS